MTPPAKSSARLPSGRGLGGRTISHDWRPHKGVGGFHRREGCPDSRESVSTSARGEAEIGGRGSESLRIGPEIGGRVSEFIGIAPEWIESPNIGPESYWILFPLSDRSAVHWAGRRAPFLEKAMCEPPFRARRRLEWRCAPSLPLWVSPPGALSHAMCASGRLSSLAHIGAGGGARAAAGAAGARGGPLVARRGGRRRRGGHGGGEGRGREQDEGTGSREGAGAGEGGQAGRCPALLPQKTIPREGGQEGKEESSRAAAEEWGRKM